jgi:preprotein translocase subunit Sec61beta
MANSNTVNMPGVFGGLTRFNEEYESMIMMKPSTVILFIILIVALRIALPYIF